LTAWAYERIAKLEVPVRVWSFMVCVDKNPILRPELSGRQFLPFPMMGVTIWKPFSMSGPDIVTLELGYPTSSFYGGEDPRNSPDIIATFKKKPAN